MFKLCGALLVLGVSVYAGISNWKRMQMRVRMLSKLTAALELLSTEIVFLQTPLPQAAEKVARQTDCAVLYAFAKELKAGILPQTAMQRAVQRNEVVNAQDADLLVWIAGGLGCSDIEAQRRHIESAVQRLGVQTAQAREVLQNNGRLSVGAGVLGGLLLVIMLL